MYKFDNPWVTFDKYSNKNFGRGRNYDRRIDDNGRCDKERCFDKGAEFFRAGDGRRDRGFDRFAKDDCRLGKGIDRHGFDGPGRGGSFDRFGKDGRRFDNRFNQNFDCSRGFDDSGRGGRFDSDI